MLPTEDNGLHEPIKISLSHIMTACFSEYTVTSQIKWRWQTNDFKFV